MIKGEKIVISGASGFLGRHLSEKLAADNELFAVGRKRPPTISCRFIEADFRERLNTSTLPPSIDRVIHLAGVTESKDLSQSDIFNINASSTMSLLDYAKSAGARQFVFTSTGNTCGYYEGTLREDSPINWDSIDFYSFSKAISEILVQRYSSSFTTLIIRPFYPYGADQPEEKIIRRLIRKVQNDEPIVTFNGGKNPRISLIHIKEFTSSFLQAMDLKESTILNLTSDEHLSIREIAELIGRLLDKKPCLIDKIDEGVKNRIGSTEKMMCLLGYHPRTRFHEGIKEVLQTHVQP